MIHSGDLDFSFSGLKTAVLYKLKSLEVGEVESLKGEIAREFEDAAVEVLVEKTREALNQNYSQILKNLRIKTLIVAGGVSANKHLRQEIEKMAQTLNLGTKFPSMELTGDNALMIGMAGFIKVSKDPSLLEKQVEIKADGNLSL
jgi:N6-L-threonylcarbamoyladenine synthase